MTVEGFQDSRSGMIKKSLIRKSNGGLPRFRRVAYAISAAYRMKMKTSRVRAAASRLTGLPSDADPPKTTLAKIGVRAKTKRLFISVARMCAAAKRLRLSHSPLTKHTRASAPAPANIVATNSYAYNYAGSGGSRASTKALLQSFRQFRVGANTSAAAAAAAHAHLPTLVVKPSGGLCNKLRVTFSYWMHCKKLRIPLTVIWVVSAACPGFFLDYFKPLPGVAFVRRQMPYHVQDDIVLGNHWHQEFDPHVTFIYQGLALLPHMEAMLHARIAELGERYVAVHIRRTDHVALAMSRNAFTSDAEFVDFLESPANSGMNIYLATDNGETQRIYMKMFPRRICGLVPIEEAEAEAEAGAGAGANSAAAAAVAAPLRLTTLEESVLDLFMCVHATNFKGSGYSSFSGTIMQMRNMEHLRVKASRLAREMR
jgi:hypothetical protein